VVRAVPQTAPFVTHNMLTVCNLRTILCSFCAEDYLQAFEDQSVTCHLHLFHRWKICRKVHRLDLGAKKGVENLPGGSSCGPWSKGWLEKVIGKYLIHNLLRIILCAKSAEDYTEKHDYQ
jgi:hypothetical protein